MKDGGVYTIWKEQGLTLRELLEVFKYDHPEYADKPVTYAGRLDPMAEGVVILLAGEAVHRKDEFLHLDKVYEFECLWGVQTDTHDTLGLVTDMSIIHPLEVDIGQIEKVAQSFVGKRIQKYPAYSSRKVKGKPLFQWAREGRLGEIEIPEHEVEIYSLEILPHRTISGSELLKNIQENISKVKGDFRQGEILKRWEEILKPLKDRQFLTTKMKAHVSSGTYIRTLVSDMGKKLGVGALAYSIVRVKVGEASLTECVAI